MQFATNSPLAKADQFEAIASPSNRLNCSKVSVLYWFQGLLTLKNNLFKLMPVEQSTPTGNGAPHEQS
jgi:hypothetical protein